MFILNPCFNLRDNANTEYTRFYITQTSELLAEFPDNLNQNVKEQLNLFNSSFNLSEVFIYKKQLLLRIPVIANIS